MLKDLKASWQAQCLQASGNKKLPAEPYTAITHRQQPRTNTPLTGRRADKKTAESKKMWRMSRWQIMRDKFDAIMCKEGKISKWERDGKAADR
jgi:hypothetical protein